MPKLASLFARLVVTVFALSFALGGGACGGGSGSGPVDDGSKDAGTTDGSRSDGAIYDDGGDIPDGGSPPQQFVDGSIPEGGAQPDPGSVRCGVTPCKTPANLCCYSELEGTPSTCAVPANPSPCGADQTTHECDETGDCPAGDLCCGEFQAGPFVITRCQTTCLGAGDLPQVCKRNGECVNGKPCTACRGQDGLEWGVCDAVPECK